MEKSFTFEGEDREEEAKNDDKNLVSGTPRQRREERSEAY